MRFLITGGGTGIGAAVARRIRLEGGKVALVGRRPELALGKPSRFSGGLSAEL